MAIPPALQRAFAAYQAGDIARAASEAAAALQASPDHSEVHYLTGVIKLRLGEGEQAEFHLRKASEANPADPERQVHLGRALLFLNRLADAQAVALSLTQRFPAYANAHRLLGEILHRADDTDGAITAYRRVLALTPGGMDVAVASRIGTLLNTQGDHAAARAMFEQAMAADQRDPMLAGIVAYAANAWSDLTPQQLFAMHTEIGRRIKAVSPFRAPPLTNTREPERPLRIAYMTPDARQHSASFFIEAILSHHDRRAFDVGLYSNAKRSADAATERLASRCDRYVTVTGMTEQQAAARIIEDRNDVLVDLAGHTAGAGVWLLRSRIAPVQVTYLGYPNTTAMPCADLRIVDSTTDPIGSDALATERLARLDPCFLCYTPPGDIPSPEADKEPRPFTFGSFNSLHKHSPATIALFAAVLKAVPGSRLVVKAKGLASSDAKTRFVREFEGHGVDAARLDLRSFVRDQHGHLAVYRTIDVALDTTPYNGTTTTCEALLMGVPVVTLLGDRHAARVSASLLRAVGGPFAELVAGSAEEFIRLAVTLADAQSPLSHSLVDRAANRIRFLESPLCDGPAFVRRLEGVYRSAWRRWCSSEGA